MGRGIQLIFPLASGLRKIAGCTFCILKSQLFIQIKISMGRFDVLLWTKLPLDSSTLVSESCLTQSLLTEHPPPKGKINRVDTRRTDAESPHPVTRETPVASASTGTEFGNQDSEVAGTLSPLCSFYTSEHGILHR